MCRGMYFVLMIALTAGGPGCAVTYVDDDNTRRIVGFVDITIRAAPEDSTFAGHVIDQRSLGLSINKGRSGGFVTFGYNREISGYLRNHALVIGDPTDFSKNETEGANNESH